MILVKAMGLKDHFRIEIRTSKASRDLLYIYLQIQRPGLKMITKDPMKLRPCLKSVATLTF